MGNVNEIEGRIMTYEQAIALALTQGATHYLELSVETTKFWRGVWPELEYVCVRLHPDLNDYTFDGWFVCEKPRSHDALPLEVKQ